MFQEDSSTHGIRRYLSLRRGKNNTSCGLKAHSAADTRILAAALEQAKKKKWERSEVQSCRHGATLPPVTHQVWKHLMVLLLRGACLGTASSYIPAFWLSRLFGPCPDSYHHCDLAAYRDVGICVKPSSITHKPPNLRRVNPSLLKPCSALSARQNHLSFLRSEKLK